MVINDVGMEIHANMLEVDVIDENFPMDPFKEVLEVEIVLQVNVGIDHIMLVRVDLLVIDLVV